MPNLPTGTMGGNVFWITLKTRNGWRLQENKVTSHFRILDPRNVRWNWGFDGQEMRDAFDEIPG